MHALVNTQDDIVRYQEFSDTPPILAAAKGLRWLPVVDEQPTPGDGEVLTAPIETVHADRVVRVWGVTAAPPSPVPAEVTNFQARAALMRGDKFDAINAALQAMGGEAWAAWEYANVVKRDGALVLALGDQVGLSASELDDLFRTAAQIEA